MDILWHGDSCFTLKTKNGVAVLNPYQSETGLKLPKIKANVVLVSKDLPDFNNVDAIEGDPKVLSWPGEYEVAEMAITAKEIASPEDKKNATMLFTIDAEGLKICYVTDLNAPFTDEIVEEIGEVDLLIVPIGSKGGYKKAHQIIEEIEPRAVIPMHYQIPGLKIELESLDEFAKQAGLQNIEPKEKFTLNSKSDLAEDKTEFIILQPQTA